MDIEDKNLITSIVEGMQETKAKKISIIDMSKLDAPCQFFVICEGTSSQHIKAIADTMRDYVRDTIKQKPFAYDGYENSEWIALDYGTAIVHIFQREAREFYDIEHLWDDAEINNLPDVD
ncbi:MAG: ribosome silencing factor [Bacteroidales bacterium]|nr:MAG: ribosome silencing factor [Bacteroidales bacterium]